MIDIRTILSETGLSNGLSETQLGKLASFPEEQSASKGTVIIREDSRTRDLYIICKGRVSIRMTLPSGIDKEEILLMLTEKQIFGEISLVDGSPRSATVRAEEDVVLLRFDYQKLIDFFEEDPRAGFHMMRNIAAILATRTRNTNLLWRNLMIW